MSIRLARVAAGALLALGLVACTTSVRIEPPSVPRAFDGLPDPARLSSAPQRLQRGTPLVLVVSKNAERLLGLLDSCRHLTLDESNRSSSYLLGLTGLTPREVHARLDIGQTYVIKVGGALQSYFGKVAFADSLADAQQRMAPNGAVALLDATGGTTRCAQTPSGDIGLLLDRIDTRIVFLSPTLARICELRSEARWSDAERQGVLSLWATSLQRHREYLDWLGHSLQQQLAGCVGGGESASLKSNAPDPAAARSR